MTSIAMDHISNLSAGYYAPLWVPIATQLIYQLARYNIYRKLAEVGFMDYASSLAPQRDTQHKWFVLLECSQVCTFFALSILTSNRSYLFPSLYSLLHLTWIEYSWVRERVSVGGDDRDRLYLDSMDGKKFFKYQASNPSLYWNS